MSTLSTLQRHPVALRQVKLNTPLASGKVSDLSYFRSPKSEASPLPPPPEYKHKIGEATFPLDELKGAFRTLS